MRVESNPQLLCFCFNLLCNWVRKLTPLSSNQMQNWNQSQLCRPSFPALWAVWLFFLWASIGCLRYFRSFWWAIENTWAQVLRQSIKKDCIGGTECLTQLEKFITTFSQVWHFQFVLTFIMLCSVCSSLAHYILLGVCFLIERMF